MGGDRIPPLSTLDRPENYKDLLKDEVDDCLGCRIIGSGAFVGLGAYSYFSGMAQLEKQKALILKSKSPFGMRSRKFGITGLSLTLVYMGIWRWTH
ncbi:hypothetical protein PpBr36_01525 [Pyricularia pennisetigena]|uniref:hypothetical protein n=1 Tax=Pyricularia pennisetigena TaxID=1578925 RepID=UPI001151852E|nr:hypothetical protein PpBr36_01525 [Pyricularia pennisetigena]TLS28693.1 hypothetical protein PpBr36_01525 [Pyricularia pennisetigena]